MAPHMSGLIRFIIQLFYFHAMGSILSIFSGKKIEEVKTGAGYILRTEKGRCRIERRPDDNCYFYDENGAEWCLFGLIQKKFKIEGMIMSIIKKKLRNERFMDKTIEMVEYDFNLVKMSPQGKRKAIWKVIEEPDLDVVKFASLIRFAPVPDGEVLDGKGKIAILVRKKDGHVMQSAPILEVEKERGL